MLKKTLIAAAILLGTLLTCIPCSGYPAGDAKDKNARILKNNRNIIRVEATGVSRIMNMAVAIAQTHGNALIARTISEDSGSSEVVLNDVIIVKRQMFREKSGAYKAVLVLEMKKEDGVKKD